MTPHDQAVQEAMTWLGTRYHHHARVKGAGVDCANFIVAVYETIGVIPPTELPPYPIDWNLHRTDELFLRTMEAIGAFEIRQAEPGDIVVFKYGRAFGHGAILIEPNRIVHSYIGLGVVTHRFNEQPICGREMKFYSPPWEK